MSKTVYLSDKEIFLIVEAIDMLLADYYEGHPESEDLQKLEKKLVK